VNWTWSGHDPVTSFCDDGAQSPGSATTSNLLTSRTSRHINTDHWRKICLGMFAVPWELTLVNKHAPVLFLRIFLCLILPIFILSCFFLYLLIAFVSSFRLLPFFDPFSIHHFVSCYPSVFLPSYLPCCRSISLPPFNSGALAKKVE
jgi:hypothetical protein